jgi:mRNA interferase MazF
MEWVPDQGDVVWIDMSPQSGHEQRGRRPALVLSPSSYNRRVGLALVCPITSKVKGYDFEVLLPPDLPVSGVILSDEVRSVDWKSRKAEALCHLPVDAIDDVLAKLRALLRPRAVPPVQ